MGICILAGAKTVTLAVSAFTLAWTHSVEKVTWQEDWQVTDTGLRIVEARVKGSGAGMEPPEGAVLKDGWWIYEPQVKAVERLSLASSGATVSGWEICGGGDCLTVGTEQGAAIVVEPCVKSD